MSTTSRRPIAPDREVVPPCSPLPRPPTVEVVPPTHAPPAAMAASAPDREVVMPRPRGRLCPSTARSPPPRPRWPPTVRSLSPPTVMVADREVALLAFGHSRLRASSRSEPPTGAVLFEHRGHAGSVIRAGGPCG